MEDLWKLAILGLAYGATYWVIRMSEGAPELWHLRRSYPGWSAPRVWLIVFSVGISSAIIAKFAEPRLQVILPLGAAFVAASGLRITSGPSVVAVLAPDGLTLRFRNRGCSMTLDLAESLRVERSGGTLTLQDKTGRQAVLLLDMFPTLSVEGVSRMGSGEIGPNMESGRSLLRKAGFEREEGVISSFSARLRSEWTALIFFSVLLGAWQISAA